MNCKRNNNKNNNNKKPKKTKQNQQPKNQTNNQTPREAVLMWCLPEGESSGFFWLKSPICTWQCQPGLLCWALFSQALWAWGVRKTWCFCPSALRKRWGSPGLMLHQSFLGPSSRDLSFKTLWQRGHRFMVDGQHGTYPETGSSAVLQLVERGTGFEATSASLHSLLSPVCSSWEIPQHLGNPHS